jgi:putative pyruvate formate lyase activating enzyme
VDKVSELKIYSLPKPPDQNMCYIPHGSVAAGRSSFAELLQCLKRVAPDNGRMTNDMNSLSLFQECLLCPRSCGVDRTSKGKKGFCRERAQLRVAYVGPHFGEEPPLSGTRGSGTVFFTGCSLGCSFCQNYQVSRDGLGKRMGVEELLRKVEAMILKDGVHNVNFITPDHFFPHAFDVVTGLRTRGHDLPVVFNLSGYQSTASLKLAHSFADVYLPDFKYSDRDLAARLSRCRDYPDVALLAIREMIRTKGFLDSLEDGGPPAEKGVLVRHLVLPGYVTNSVDALTTLFLEFGRSLPVSLMSQYCPVLHNDDANLNRRLTKDEFDLVCTHALELGFEHLFIQTPDETEGAVPGKAHFVPDFRLSNPFASSSPED